MLEKKTIVNNISCTRFGPVDVQFGLLVVDGEEEISKKWHRVSLGPDADVDGTISLVCAHIERMGYPVPAAADIQRVKDVSAAHFRSFGRLINAPAEA